VNVGREKIKLFTLTGVLGAFAAVLLTAEGTAQLRGPGRQGRVRARVILAGVSRAAGIAAWDR
jgi:ribose/xylose/arabinose/galactoside ABC-type transport system permease subunit